MTFLIILNLLGMCKINWILRVSFQYLFIIFPFYEICVDMSFYMLCLSILILEIYKILVCVPAKKQG
jgi:hypothetical protein